MHYCRSLKFEGEPDYDYCVSLFDKCMSKNYMDSQVLDFTWKTNQKAKEKEELKNSMKELLRKKDKVVAKDTMADTTGGL